MTSEESVLLFSSFSESGIGTKEYSALFESLCRYGESKVDPILRPDKDIGNLSFLFQLKPTFPTPAM